MASFSLYSTLKNFTWIFWASDRSRFQPVGGLRSRSRSWKTQAQGRRALSVRQGVICLSLKPAPSIKTADLILRRFFLQGARRELCNRGSKMHAFDSAQPCIDNSLISWLWPDVGLMLGHRRRRWSDINPTLVKRYAVIVLRYIIIENSSRWPQCCFKVGLPSYTVDQH